MPRIPTLAFALPILLASSGAALAHAHLKNAEPAAEGTVAAAPSEVAINFTEGVEPKFSTIEVQDAKGQRVDKADPHLAPTDNKRLLVGLGTLTPGTYTVVWHATAVDTHKTDGTFHFTVRAAASAGIVIDNVWSRATPPNAKTAAAYLTLTANGPADRFTAASTPVAGIAELHETINDQGVMRMRPVGTLALEPGKPVSLAPGGYHVMLMELKHPLKAGDHFPLTLSFEHAPPMTVDVTVQPIGTAAPMNHAPMNHAPMNMGGATK